MVGSRVYAGGDEVTFAMLPQMSNVALFKAWKPILEYLEKETGLKFKQVFPKNFAEHIKMCKEGKIDFAYSNPLAYIQMSPKEGVRTHGHKAMAIAVQRGGTSFYGEFIIRVDNDEIKKFEDIKGKKGWIVGYKSAGGFLFQQAYALDHGIDLTKDCTLVESPGNKQEKVIMAVYNREADFGCVRDGMRAKLAKRIDINQIKVLAETPRYPSWAFSAYDGVASEIVRKVKNALLHIPPEIFEKAKLPGKVSAFKDADDSAFDPVRELADKVGVLY